MQRCSKFIVEHGGETMTRRERLERKLELRDEWAEKAKKRAEDRYSAAGAIANGIPLGQPVLIGHHSEKRHRRDLARIDNNMKKSFEETEKAEHHHEKANGLARQLDHSIYSDDNDAIEALEARIAENEAKAEENKKINSAWRKSGADGLRSLGLSETVIAELAKRIRLYPWIKKPCNTGNLRARIRSDKERIETIRQRSLQTEKAENAGGVLIEKSDSGEWVNITFAEKPEREILNALKAANFFWSGSKWHGYWKDLPACISELAENAT